MKVDVLDLKGKSVESVDIKDYLLSERYNPDLIAQAVYVYQSNKRMTASHAKTRGDVSGTGARPWKQKGTGRARHSSKRSPIWVGGGVTFAPSGKNWDKKLNQKMRLKSLLSALTKKFTENELTFRDFTDFDRKSFDVKNKYFVVTENTDLYKSLRNLENVAIIAATDLNTLHVVSSDILYFDKNSITNLEGRFNNEN